MYIFCNFTVPIVVFLFYVSIQLLFVGFDKVVLILSPLPGKSELCTIVTQYVRQREAPRTILKVLILPRNVRTKDVHRPPKSGSNRGHPRPPPFLSVLVCSERMIV